MAVVRSSWLLGFGLCLVAIFLGIQIFVLVPLLRQLTADMESSSSSSSHHHHHHPSKMMVGAVAAASDASSPDSGSSSLVLHTITTNKQQQQPQQIPSDHVQRQHQEDDPSSPIDLSFDIVTLVHHDDLSVLLDFGLESWQTNFCQDDTRIFIVCTPQAEIQLQEFVMQENNNNNTNNTSIDWTRIVLINQVLYPFDLELAGIYTWQNKHTWIYQQLLKLYAYEVLSLHPTVPLKRRFLALDSDTVAVRPYQFLSPRTGYPIYTIASLSSGAFQNDCTLQSVLLREVFKDGSVSVAFPYHAGVDGGERFTTIAHHMMMDGHILTAMLHSISTIHNEPAWQILGSLKKSVLSEWELYMAWMMKHHRHELHLSQTPYMNTGVLTKEYIEWIHHSRDIVYMSKHDDYGPQHKCCVNSKWPMMISSDPIHSPNCHCCTVAPGKCHIPKFTCNKFGIKGCHYNDQDGLFSFDKAPPTEAVRLPAKSKTTMTRQQQQAQHHAQTHPVEHYNKKPVPIDSSQAQIETKKKFLQDHHLKAPQPVQPRLKESGGVLIQKVESPVLRAGRVG